MVDYEEELDRYLDEIKELARSKQYARLRDLFLPMEPADIALLLEESGGELMPLLYRLLPKELAAEVFVDVIADGVSWVRRVDKNTTLYISDNDLYSYDGKEKTRLLTDVDQMWCRDTLAGTTIDLGWYGY